MPQSILNHLQQSCSISATLEHTAWHAVCHTGLNFPSCRFLKWLQHSKGQEGCIRYYVPLFVQCSSRSPRQALISELSPLLRAWLELCLQVLPDFLWWCTMWNSSKPVLIESCSHVSSVFVFRATDNHKRQAYKKITAVEWNKDTKLQTAMEKNKAKQNKTSYTRDLKYFNPGK